MKTLKKIILLLVLCPALFIIFYPVDHKINIEGTWSVDKVLVSGVQKASIGTVDIYENKINTYGATLFDDNTIYEFKLSDNDSILIFKKKVVSNIGPDQKNIDLEGKYKVKLQSKIIGGDTNAYYDIRLKFISKNNFITISRTESVQWNTRSLR